MGISQASTRTMMLHFPSRFAMAHQDDEPARNVLGSGSSGPRRVTPRRLLSTLGYTLTTRFFAIGNDSRNDGLSSDSDVVSHKIVNGIPELIDMV